MGDRHLINLTIEFLKAFGSVEDAEKTYELLPINRNKMLVIEAESAFDKAAYNLSNAIGDSTLHEYLNSFNGVIIASANYLSRDKIQRNQLTRTGNLNKKR